MNYLNGVSENKDEKQAKTAHFLESMPDPVPTSIIDRINNRIENMNDNYNLYLQRNSIYAEISKLETRAKILEDEIKRL